MKFVAHQDILHQSYSSKPFDVYSERNLANLFLTDFC